MVQIFGILNITPDSFSDGGLYLNKDKALDQADKLLADGADFIDVGGESTRPQAQALNSDQEWERLGGIVEVLIDKYPDQISLDTRHAQTAEAFFQLGGTILNDVSGFFDPVMRDLAAQYGGRCIVNHFPGATPQEVHEKQIDDINVVEQDLLDQKALLLKAGVEPDNIILDPGIGFGKTMALNRKLLQFGALLPQEKILIGHSRKRFLGDDRFETGPNQEAGRVAIAAGASFLRVHEPKDYNQFTSAQV